MKNQQYNSHYGNKGMIFTLDVVIALIIFIIVLAVTSFFIAKSAEDKLSKINMYNAGSDILNIMDKKGILKQLDIKEINKELQKVLQSKYAVRIQIETDKGDKIDTGEELPPGRFIASGERFALVSVEHNNL